MDNVIYLDFANYSDSITNAIDRKPAKISKEKLANLKLKTFEIKKTFRKVEKTPKQVAPAPAPVIEKPVVAPVVNFADLVKSHNVKAYKNAKGAELPVVAGRKIKCNPSVARGATKLALTGTEVINLTKVVEAKPVQEPVIETPIAPLPEPVIEAPVEVKAVETAPVVEAKPAAVQEPVIAKTPVDTPAQEPINIDDYLGHLGPDDTKFDDTEILQLQGDINDLTSQISAKVVQYNELKKYQASLESKRVERIKELEQEKLEKTMVLDELTKKLDEMQREIDGNKKALGISAKAA